MCTHDCFNCTLPDCTYNGNPTREERAEIRARDMRSQNIGTIPKAKRCGQKRRKA